MTSLMEMLMLPNFGRMTTSTTELKSRDKTLLLASWTTKMVS